MFLLVWLVLFGGAWSGSTAILSDEAFDEKLRSGFYFPGIVKHLSNGGEDRWLKQYFGKNTRITWLDETNDSFKTYKRFLLHGLTSKGLTFNVYDDDMRVEAITLFRLLQTLDIEMFYMTVAWASINVNDGILEYALRLAILHTEHLSSIQIPPPFATRPNYFFNSETIRKANYLKLRNGLFIGREAKVNQYYRSNDTISINTNYSGWNLLGNGCVEKLAYFREDIGLNSFYYGIHLSSPFWMSNDELEKLSPRRIEHYYYIHQQLLSRYLLEAEANGISEDEAKVLHDHCDFPIYNPYLEYRNGLSFPVRYPFSRHSGSEAAAYLSSVDTIINEFADRGLDLIKTYGPSLNITEDNFMETVSKLIRANVDGVKYAKIVRSLYGAQGYPVDRYNPAPSILHHPETSMRDPIYWSLINCVMNYFHKFKTYIPMHNLKHYETDDFKITQKEPPKLVTYFEYYQADISSVLGERIDNTNQRNLIFTARQKRLTHLPFSVEFDIESKEKKFAIIRLYLGPKCSAEVCFVHYNRWIEIDTFKVYLNKGVNYINWSTQTSEKYSRDDIFNIELQQEENERLSKFEYNMFKFPERLALPRGSTEGFNVTLFVMVTEDKAGNNIDNETTNNKQRDHISANYDLDENPLGFPFDRTSINYNSEANNYRFIDVAIFNHNSEKTLI